MITDTLITRQVANFPPGRFCTLHDRFVDTVLAMEADETLHEVCAYCADETLIGGTADRRFPIQQAYGSHFVGYTKDYTRNYTTYVCPYVKCTYSTHENHALQQHMDFIHRNKSASRLCYVCEKTGAQYCNKCERMFCLDHVDLNNECYACADFNTFGMVT